MHMHGKCEYARAHAGRACGTSSKKAMRNPWQASDAWMHTLQDCSALLQRKEYDYRLFFLYLDPPPCRFSRAPLAVLCRE